MSADDRGVRSSVQPAARIFFDLLVDAGLLAGIAHAHHPAIGQLRTRHIERSQQMVVMDKVVEEGSRALGELAIAAKSILVVCRAHVAHNVKLRPRLGRLLAVTHLGDFLGHVLEVVRVLHQRHHKRYAALA